MVGGWVGRWGWGCGEPHTPHTHTTHPPHRGVTPDTSFANYASTNLLRLALTRVFAEELRTTGVTVYAVEPGQSDTPIFGKQSAVCIV